MQRNLAENAKAAEQVFDVDISFIGLLIHQQRHVRSPNFGILETQPFHVLLV